MAGATTSSGVPAQRRSGWLDRFDAPPPTFARRLAAAVEAAAGGRVDPAALRPAVHALAVLRAHEGHAAAGLVEDLAALRDLLPADRESVRAFDVALADAVTAYVDELTALLTERATRDPLTGLPNRAAFGEALAHEVAAGGRGHPPSLLLVDLDGFKTVNDTDGHLAGDDILINVGRLLSSQLRAGDVACRLGGDEFAVVLPRTSRRNATAVAHRLLRASHADDGLASPSARVRLSVGVGWLRRPPDPESLIALADSALYAVKAAGGDGVRVGGGR